MHKNQSGLFSMKKRIYFALIGLCFAFSGCEFFRIQAVNKMMDNAECDQARIHLLKYIKSKPEALAYNYNLVFAFLCQKDDENALKQMNILLQQVDGQPRFNLLFLKGWLLGETGKVEPALMAYQEALEIVPASKEVKQNMELLLSENKSGTGGKKSKGGKSGDKQDQKDKDSKGDESSEKNDPSNSQKSENSDDGKAGQKKKKMSSKQIEKIMKEIESNESKVRAKGLKVESKGSDDSGKDW